MNSPRAMDEPNQLGRLDAVHLDKLARLLQERVGLHIRPEGWGSLRLAISARLGPSPGARQIDAWLATLQDDEEELRRLLPLVTVGKTSFFRDEGQFRAFASVLPGWIETARNARRPISIWSVGCATGEEPHSLAMAALEAGAEPPELEILGTDVNPAAVAFAAAGRYPLQRMDGLSRERLDRFFQVAEGIATARSQVRRATTNFAVQNLADERYPLPRTGAWDAIFCRNVLIYFNLPTTLRVLERFERVLRPGGLLFLGYSESLFRVFDRFDLVEHEGSFFYRKPTGIRPAAPQVAPREPPVIVPAPRVPSPPPPKAAAAAAPTPPSLPEIGVLIEGGRFDEARRALDERLLVAPEDVGARLTLANLLVLLRLPAEARACYEAALDIEPLRAEAHLLFGIHLLAQGDLEHAGTELSRALFLDPELGLGHYFLGRCRERLGDLDGARRGYRNALGAFREAQAPRRFLGFYPDLPADDGPFANAAESALRAL